MAGWRQCARVMVAAVLGLMLGGCSGMMFYPMKQLLRTPADLGLGYRDVTLRTTDGVDLHGWWLDAREPVRGTVLFLHGNAENISTHIGSVSWLPAAGYQVLLIDYRGFGRSGGAPQLPAVLADIRAAFEWLLHEPAAAGQPLFLLGQSIGASLGGYLAGTRPELRDRLSAVVLDAGFARYSWIAREVAARSWLTRALQGPIAWSMPDGYDLLDVVGGIAPVPLLIIHGREDEIVPYRHALALHAAAREPRFLLSYDGPHIGSFQDPQIRMAVLDFFADVAAGGHGGDAARRALAAP